MNKKRVDQWILTARDAIKDCGIADKKTGKVAKEYRSQISAFGASIIMGSFKSAVMFYSQQGNADTDRSLLLSAIYYVLHPGTVKTGEEVKEILAEVCSAADPKQMQNDFIDASIALKLAMNFFVLTTEKSEKKEGGVR